MDVTIPGWTPVNSHIPPTLPFFGSMSAFGRCRVFLPGACVSRSNFFTPKEGEMLPIFFWAPFAVQCQIAPRHPRQYLDQGIGSVLGLKTLLKSAATAFNKPLQKQRDAH